jgi:hypothetical protein
MKQEEPYEYQYAEMTRERSFEYQMVEIDAGAVFRVSVGEGFSIADTSTKLEEAGSLIFALV